MSGEQGYGSGIGAAISMIQSGEKARRKGWNGKGMYIFYVPEDFDGSTITRAHIMMLDAQQQLVPWLASQTDILADDWEVVEDV